MGFPHSFCCHCAIAKYKREFLGKARAKHDFAVMVKKFQLAVFFVVLGKDYLKINLEL